MGNCPKQKASWKALSHSSCQAASPCSTLRRKLEPTAKALTLGLNWPRNQGKELKSRDKTSQPLGFLKAPPPAARSLILGSESNSAYWLQPLMSPLKSQIGRARSLVLTKHPQIKVIFVIHTTLLLDRNVIKSVHHSGNAKIIISVFSAAL